jgi:DNA-damage-inducible protein D
MKKELVTQLHASFESIASTDTATGAECWLARDLQDLLGYAKWDNFSRVIERAKTACVASGHTVEDHFLDVGKMIDLGKGATRQIDDMALTRYACYLIAQNGNPSKEAIAFAQTYFAVQTRKQEIIEQRLEENERINERKKLSHTEKELSGIIFERVGDQFSFARIRSKGDVALFGGNSTQDMKKRLGVPDSRPLADFLPTITIKAKDFASEITNFNIKKDGLRSEPDIAKEHVKNNTGVRKLLVDSDIRPETLPASEDIKKVERRLVSETKKLTKKSS